MKKDKNKINSLGAVYFNDPIVDIDKKGRMILKASGLIRQEKFYGATFGLAGLNERFLDFNTIYKWPDLIQTNYSININLEPWTVISGGKVFDYDRVMKFEDIKIHFEKRVTSLTSYLDSKKGDLDLFLELREALTGEPTQIRNYGILGSRQVNRLLSVAGTWRAENRKIDIIGGVRNIFESNELIDQLVIAILLNFAKRHSVSRDILTALIADRVRLFTRKLVETIHDIDPVEFEDEAIAFLNLILAGKNERFVFIPKNSQSFYHWFLGTGNPVLGNKKGRWIPKLQEYFKDRLEKFYIEANHRLELKESEKKDEILINLIDENAENKIASTAEISNIKNQISRLPARTQEILTLWSEDISLDIIGERVGLKKARISQIIKESLGRLKKELGQD